MAAFPDPKRPVLHSDAMLGAQTSPEHTSYLPGQPQKGAVGQELLPCFLMTPIVCLAPMTWGTWQKQGMGQVPEKLVSWADSKTLDMTEKIRTHLLEPMQKAGTLAQRS